MVLTLLPYWWIYKRYIGGDGKGIFRGRRKLLFWLMPAVVLGYSGYLALQPNFLPGNPALIDIWFVVMVLLAVPQFVFTLCSVSGWAIRRWRHGTRNWGNLLGLVLGVVAFFCFIYGFTHGFRKMQVKRLTLYVPDLPKAFDGYRIVQFSDIHLGSFYGWRSNLPQRDIDSINAEHADLVCFTGDLQNVEPSELPPYTSMLRSIKAKDGVLSILGNHDYSWYVGTDDEQEKLRIEQEVQRYERNLGWRLLMNEHVAIHRGKDSIFVAGTENYEKPGRTEVARSLYGIRPGSFVLMLQHIPKQWEEMWPSTINEKHGSKDSVLVAPQLTLSGHTHAGQISILGLRPTMFSPFDYGLYEREGCQLYTTSGLGGTVPIRIGATAEIVVITLRRK